MRSTPQRRARRTDTPVAAAWRHHARHQRRLDAAAVALVAVVGVLVFWLLPLPLPPA